MLHAVVRGLLLGVDRLALRRFPLTKRFPPASSSDQLRRGRVGAPETHAKGRRDVFSDAKRSAMPCGSIAARTTWSVARRRGVANSRAQPVSETAARIISSSSLSNEAACRKASRVARRPPGRWLDPAAHCSAQPLRRTATSTTPRAALRRSDAKAKEKPRHTTAIPTSS